MSEHKARVEWNLQGAFEYKTYSRTHSMDFGGGLVVAGNAAAGNIPPTVPAAHGVDPEQAFVASLSTCHMLWFLHVACRAKFTVTRYLDEASGVLEKGPQGKWMMTRVTLRPAVSFSGTPPTPEQHEQLHHKAHEECYIANSVTSGIECLPTIS